MNLPTDGVHRSIGLDEVGAIDLVARPLGPDDLPDRGGERAGVRLIATQERLDIHLIEREQTVAEFPFRCES